MVYIYRTPEVAEKISHTIEQWFGYLGYADLRVVGSAVVCDKSVYETMIAETDAPKALLIANEAV